MIMTKKSSHSNKFCILKTFNNPIKTCFPNNKYTLHSKTLDTNCNNYFLMKQGRKRTLETLLIETPKRLIERRRERERKVEGEI